MVSYPIPELERLRGPRASITRGLVLATSAASGPAGPAGPPGPAGAAAATSILVAGGSGMADVAATLRFLPSAVAAREGELACGVRVLWSQGGGGSGDGSYVDILVEQAAAGGARALVVRQRLSEAAALALDDGAGPSVAWEPEPELGGGGGTFLCRTSRHPLPDLGAATGASGPGLKHEVALRVLVDRSVVEAFADGGLVTHWVHQPPPPPPPPPEGVGSRAAAGVPAVVGAASIAAIAMGSGGSCEFASIDVWPMRPFTYNTERCSAAAPC